MTDSEDTVTSHGRVSGWVLKGSEVVNGLACWRFGVLEGRKFLSFRSETDEQPSSEWELAPGCDITKLEQRDIHVKAKGKSTFVALVAGRYGKIEGYQFSIIWPHSNHSRSSKGNRLILGFELETVAARWQTAFLQSREDLEIAQQEATVSSPPPLPMDSPPYVQNKTKEGDLIDLEDSPRGKRNPTLPSRALDSQMQSQTLFFDADTIARSVSYSSSLGGVDPSPDSTTTRSRSYGFWSPWKHVNGVAIYKEEDPAEGVAAFMVSCAIRSPPSVCFEALMAGNKDQSMTRGSSDFLSMDIIDKLDEDVEVVHGYLAPRGWISSLLAQRYIVLERNWRKEEEDGTYVVVLKSSEKFLTESSNSNCLLQHHPTVGQRFWNPIKAQVMASVFTIAPLKQKHYPVNCTESPEALVTMVLKIDLGGMLSPNSFFHPLSHFLSIEDSWIESILMTVVSLRDRAEQSRFVSVPISIDSSSCPPSASIDPEKEAPGASNVCHWTEAEREDLSNLANVSSTFQRPEEVDAIRAASLARSLDVEIPPELRTTGTCDSAYWMCPGSADFKVRGPSYLTDRKKIPATEPMFELHSVDLVKVKQPTTHIARFLNSVQQCPSAFAFVMQIMVPGPPDLGLVITWRSKDDGHGMDSSSSLNLDHQVSEAVTEPEQEMLPFELALMRFVTGDDETRDSSFKLIPHIVKGSFIIRQSVGSTPVILGKKLKQYYFKHQRYIEVDIDIGSSYTAATVVSMVSGVTKTLVVDLAVVLEGKSAAELPESLLGTVRMDRLDLATAVDLDTSEKKLLRNFQQSSCTEEQQEEEEEDV